MRQFIKQNSSLFGCHKNRFPCRFIKTCYDPGFSFLENRSFFFSLVQFKSTAKRFRFKNNLGENDMFRNFFITVDGQEKDALQNGGLGCSTVVSSILYLQNSSLEFQGKSKWLSFTHANVLAVEKDMATNGWHEINDLREGAVITWELQAGSDGQAHYHMGFYVGGERAVSNSSNQTGVPMEHHYTYDGTRKVIRIWWHSELGDK